MITMHGKSLSGGIAMGNLSFFKRKAVTPSLRRVDDTEAEAERFRQARDAAAAQLERLCIRAEGKVGREDAAIFRIHLMLLSDRDYVDSAIAMIRSFDMNAEYSVKVTCENFANMLRMIDDPYMQGRAADIKDVSDRVIRILSGVSDKVECPEKPSIMVADEFFPSEVIELGINGALGFLSAEGSSTSHASILSRNMQLPSVITSGKMPKKENDGQSAVIDGFTGTVYVDPDESTKHRMNYRIENIHSVNRLAVPEGVRVG